MGINGQVREKIDSVKKPVPFCLVRPRPSPADSSTRDSDWKMASATNLNTLPHAERADIHKSCKSIETLLNALNEYCEAAGTVVALQKKLAKALRETAGIKVTGEIPGAN